jgi:predicted neuraminidase
MNSASKPPEYITPQPGLVTSELIYEDAPFPSCHASTLAESGDALVAAWFGGTHENHPDVCIWLSRRERTQEPTAGSAWTPPVKVADGVMEDGKRYAAWNPVLFQPADGPLLLFYKLGPDPRTWWGMMTHSHDGGRSWTPPSRLPDGVLGPIKNKPIQLSNGDLLCPSSTEDNAQGWRIHFERTPDLGKTWQTIGPINDGKEFGAIQPSLLTYANGRMQAVCRSEQGVLVESWSSDDGQTWSAMRAMSLPNPNSGTDAVTLADGRQLLVYNHITDARTPLNVAVSTDGVTWQMAFILEDQPGEYSYPAVIQTADGLVHITYTWHRTRIKHVVLDPTQFIFRPLPKLP